MVCDDAFAGVYITREQYMQMAPKLAADLGVPLKQVTSALALALEMLKDASPLPCQGMKLHLFHSCRSQDSSDSQCAQQLRTRFAPLQPLTAPCGAHLQLQLIRSDGFDLTSELLSGLFIQVSAVVVDATRATSSRIGRTGLVQESKIDTCLSDGQAQGKLRTSSHSTNSMNPCGLFFPMRQPSITLPELCITESSEAAAASSGQQKLRLRIRAVDFLGTPISGIAELYTSEFWATSSKAKPKQPDIASALTPQSNERLLSESCSQTSADESPSEGWMECTSSSCMECGLRRQPLRKTSRGINGAAICHPV